MVSKKDLLQIDKLRRELIDLQRRKKLLSEKPVKVVMDSVQSSSREFPYTRHTTIVEGIEDKKNIRKYKHLIYDKEEKLQKLINEIEYELNNIDDSEIRQIIRMRYEDGFSWSKIAIILKYENEEVPRKRLNRYLDKKFKGK